MAESGSGAGGGGGDGNPYWKGLLKWSLAHSDGTASARQLSDGDRKWFMEAMEAQTVDVIKRMKEITLVMSLPLDVLEAQGVTSEQLEGMLEELQEHVESMDMANDLHSIGGLVPLLSYLKNPHASIRARAAEVVSTIVQNNPRSQELVMEAKGLEPLLFNFASDSDMTVRTKSLGAISSLIRHNKPGTVAFRLANGYAGLKDALISEHTRFQRKALQLLQYLLQENPNDCYVAVELGFTKSLIGLASSSDADTRQAALHALLEIARNGKTDLPSLASDNSQLRQVLECQIQSIHNMDPEDLGSVREECLLLDSLWQHCFNKPSSLRLEGLLVLPSEEEPPPDVASEIFEPVLRAWSNPHLANRQKATTDAKDEVKPLLLGPCSPDGGASGS